MVKCPYLAADAAVWAAEQELDPADHISDYLRSQADDRDEPEPAIEDMQFGKHLTRVISNCVDLYVALFDLEQAIDCDINEALEACLQSFDLEPTATRKIDVLKRVTPLIINDRSESPIERLFKFALLINLAVVYREWRISEDGILIAPHIQLLQQTQIDAFRVDFLIKIKNGSRIVIECDGHEFHERTKQQAQRDRSRDRWFQRNNYIVLRFTGSEIWQDGIGCAREVLDLLIKRAPSQ